jgi:hypothetical protein
MYSGLDYYCTVLLVIPVGRREIGVSLGQRNLDFLDNGISDSTVVYRSVVCTVRLWHPDEI